MAVFHAFRALRPTPEKAADVAALPYDVVNREEAKSIGDENPLSFLHIDRPEIEKGEYNPTIKLCRRICRILDKSLDDLFWEDDEDEENEK